MASEDGLREKVGRKLTKRRKDAKRVSLDIPERFKDGDDAQDDVTAPKSKETMAMNQSIFSMIARAGQQSQTDLRTVHEVDSGESDEEGGDQAHFQSLDGAARLSRLSTANTWEAPGMDEEVSKDKEGKHRRGLSEHRLLKSLPKLSMKTRKDSGKENPSGGHMSSSQVLPARPTDEDSAGASQDETTQRRKIKMKDQGAPDAEKLPLEPRRSRHGSTASASKSKAPLTLAQRLQQIFEFEALEEVISGLLLQPFPQLFTDRHRISLLAFAEYPSSGLYVYYSETHMLLCVHSQEICGHLQFSYREYCSYTIA